MLRQNLQALAARDPEFYERICWPVENDHVLHDDSGDVHYRIGDGRYRLSLAADADADTIARALAPAAAVPAGTTIFVFGVGLGELVDALLAARPDVAVVAWDRDPWLMRLALGAHDWSRELASGRLRLLLGSDLVAAASRTPAAIVFHPFLSAVYRTERSWLQGAGDGGPAAAAAARPLALLCAGGLFVDDLATALRQAGFALYTADIHRLSQQELARTVRQLRPTVIAAINYTEGLAEFAAAHGCKLLCWEIDPATSALPPCRADTAGAFIFTYRRANVAELRAAGFQHVEYLPLGADPTRRAPVALDAGDRQRYGAPVSFVGSSLAPQADGFRRAFAAGLAALAPSVRDAGALLAELLAEQARDFSRYDLPATLLRLCPPLARAPAARVAELARFAGEVAAADKRQAYVRRLGRFGIHVWGDDGWQAAVDAGVPAGAGAGATYRGRAGHAVELSKITAPRRSTSTWGGCTRTTSSPCASSTSWPAAASSWPSARPRWKSCSSSASRSTATGRRMSSRPRSLFTWAIPGGRAPSPSAGGWPCCGGTPSVGASRTCWPPQGCGRPDGDCNDAR